MWLSAFHARKHMEKRQRLKGYKGESERAGQKMLPTNKDGLLMGRRKRGKKPQV